MEVVKVTREMIRAIKPLDMEVYTLPTKQACYSARVQVAYVKDIDGIDLKCHINSAEKKVIIKRLS